MTESTTLNDPRWAKLSSKRQDELLEKYRDINVDHDWWDYTYDWFKEKCVVVGIDVSDMYFSGFWSQGDGASFEGRVDDWAKVLKAVDKGIFLDDAKKNYWRFSIATRGSYYHSHTMNGSLEAELEENPYDEEEEPLQFDAWRIANPLCQADLDDLETVLTDYCRSLANKLYHALEEEYEYLTSDEIIVDWILENLDDDELRDPDEEDEPDQEDEGDLQVDHSRQLELF